jgi:hypothetical protein
VKLLKGGRFSERIVNPVLLSTTTVTSLGDFDDMHLATLWLKIAVHFVHLNAIILNFRENIFAL